jgi:hypothetical protein
MKTNCGSSPESTTELKECLQGGGWQICPKCQGQGNVWYPPNIPWNQTYLSDGRPFECDVCKGRKIISIDTGLPPIDSPLKDN